MEEYVEDELADGENNEKRIQRADYREGRKLKTAKGAKSRKFPIRKKGSGVLPLGRALLCQMQSQLAFTLGSRVIFDAHAPCLSVLEPK